jgi:hypothetical protein
MSSKDYLIAENETLLVKLGILRTVLSALHRGHTICEDGFYSCPKAEGYFGNEDSDYCDCGADATNNLIEATLEETK